MFRVHVYDEHLANEHDYGLFQYEYVHAHVAHEKLQNAHADDEYHERVNGYVLSVYECVRVNVFHCL